MRLTVQINTHHRPALFADLVDDLLAQTSLDFEIVHLDDASSPEEQEQIREQLDRLRRAGVRVDSEMLSENLGPGPARNRILRRIRTPYTCFIDPDDRVPCDMVAQRLAAIESLGAPLIWHDLILVGSPWMPHPRDPAKRVHLINYAPIGGTWTVCSQLVRVAGGFGEYGPACDIQLWERMCARVEPVYHPSTVLVYQRTHSQVSKIDLDSTQVVFSL